ncbi:hypothetical protein [Ammoniphilus sp. YIM 78166]|uniref:hypothetical protein n=1 Tax=Ammoniphilus sp. YIM 78166 TaxID=1644106 RepID=UPI00106F8E60|nr:hypothetical protein [Ammoniphilus sp. YIM 78166]
MLYLITQFDVSDLDRQEYAQQASGFHEKLIGEGCRILLHSDRLESFVYGIEEEKEENLRKLCKAFQQYSKQMAQADFLYDFFTREEIIESGHFDEGFIQALHRAEDQ